MPQSEPADRQHYDGRVASVAPGRMRIKLQHEARHNGVMQRLKKGLESHRDIHSVAVNPHTGSVVVNYDARRRSDDVFDWMRDLDVVVKSVSDVPSVAAGERRGEERSFLQAIDDLNRRIFMRTGMEVDLRNILPLSFIAAGVWSVARKGLMIEQLPGWLYLWLAFDTYVKLHPHRRMSPPA